MTVKSGTARNVLSSLSTSKPRTTLKTTKTVGPPQQPVYNYLGSATLPTPPKATTAPAITSNVQSQMAATPGPVSTPAYGPAVPPVVPVQPPSQVGAYQAASGTGGVVPPGGNPSGSGFNGGTSDPLTGYLAQFGYTPLGAADLYNNPLPLASDVLGTFGITNPGMAQQMSDLFDSALAGQFITNRGQDPTDDATLNFIAHAMQQAGTPGGSTLNYDYLLNTILGATDPDKNPLGNYMQYDAQGNPLTSAQQAQTVNSLASQALVALNPYAQRAYSGALGRIGNDYQAGAMKGQPGADSYIQYLANSPFANYF